MNFLRPKNGKDLFAVLLWLISIAITLIITINHEPWGDEADSWLVARDSTVWQVLSQANWRGTPSLWYLLLMPFAKLGLPYFTQQIIHFLIAQGTIFLLLFYSPLPKRITIPAIFSVHLGYQYIVVARNFSVLIFLLFYLAALYPQRLQRILAYSIAIALLCQTSVHGLLIACILSISYFYDLYKNKLIIKYIKYLIIIVISIFIAYWQLSPYGSGDILSAYYKISLSIFWESIVYAFVQLPITDHSLPALIILALLVLLTLKSNIDRPTFYIFWGSFLVLEFVFVFKWWSFRHSGLIYILLIYYFWINAEKLKEQMENNSILYVGLLALSVSGWISWSWKDYSLDYSGSYETSQFIKSHFPSDILIASTNEFPTVALLPYLNHKKIWYAQRENFGSFLFWDKKYYEGLFLSTEQAVERVYKHWKNSRFILVSDKLIVDEFDKLTLRFASSESICSDKFLIYEHSP